MRKSFHVYEYLAPVILAPGTGWLWWNTLAGAWTPFLAAWLIPIVFAYVVPGIGTNVLKVWEINTRYRVGRFRIHHGFVFGSASSLLAWIVYTPVTSLSDVMVYAFILASVLGFWNILYDIAALKSGYINIYNQPWADGKDPEAIIHDYAPVYFGGFGFLYGLAIGVSVLLNDHVMLNKSESIGFIITALILSIFLPIIVYRWDSFRKHGHSGCRPIEKYD